MPTTATITSVDATLNRFIVKGKIAVSGSYPGTPGDTLSFKNMGGAVPAPATDFVPDFVVIEEAPAAGASASGLQYTFAPGTTQANGQLQVFVCAGAGSKSQQLGNVTYGSVGAANIIFRAEFQKFL